MPFVLNAVTGWHDPAAGDAHSDWARAVSTPPRTHRPAARTSTSSATRTTPASSYGEEPTPAWSR